MKKYWWIWAFGIVVFIFGISIIGKKITIGKAIGLIEIKDAIQSSKEIIKDIEKCKKNPNIQAVVVHIESPGGTVVPCQEIYKAIKELEKPTVASLGTYAASGGYYIACACDKIVSNPGTMTGSIGVIMNFPNVSELIKKIGLKFNVIKSRPHKDIGSPYRELTPEEHKLLKGVVDDVYDQFVEAVVEGRGLSRDEVLEVADGRIMSGRQAFEVGLVDTLGTLHDAKLLAGSLAEIKGEPKVIEFRKPLPRWRKLLKGSIGDKEWIRLEYR